MRVKVSQNLKNIFSRNTTENEFASRIKKCYRLLKINKIPIVKWSKGINKYFNKGKNTSIGNRKVYENIFNLFRNQENANKIHMRYNLTPTHCQKFKKPEDVRCFEFSHTAARQCIDATTWSMIFCTFYNLANLLLVI